MTALLSQPTLAPDFELESHQGDRVRLLEGRDGLTLLVFVRGHWCPYCRRYLKKLQANAGRFAERNVRVLIVSPEPTVTSRELAGELGISFPILSDAGGRVIDRFGTRNGPAGSNTVLPHPSVFLIDSSGAIRFRKIDRNFKRRTTMHALFTAIAEAGA